MSMKTVYSGGEAEIVEKKSRFIATVRPVSSEEEAVACLKKKKTVREKKLSAARRLLF